MFYNYLPFVLGIDGATVNNLHYMFYNSVVLNHLLRSMDVNNLHYMFYNRLNWFTAKKAFPLIIYIICFIIVSSSSAL